MAVQLGVTFTGLTFENPFLLASAPPTESDTNIMRAFDAGWGGVVTKTIGLHPVVNVAGPKTKFLRATPESSHLSMQKRAGAALQRRRRVDVFEDEIACGLEPVAELRPGLLEVLVHVGEAGILEVVRTSGRAFGAGVGPGHRSYERAHHVRLYRGPPLPGAVDPRAERQ